MSERTKIIPFFLLFLICFLLGGSLLLVGFAGALITSTTYQNFTFEQYAFTFIPLAIGGVIASLSAGQFGATKGIYKPFAIGFLLQILFIFLVGMVLISIYSPALNLVFYWVALLCLGASYGCIYTTFNLLAASLFPKRLEVALLLIYSSAGIGTAIASLFLERIFLYLIVMLLSYIFLFFLCDFLLQFPEKKAAPSLPLRGLWPLLCTLALYGIIDTLFNNWDQYYWVTFEGVLPSEAKTTSRWFSLFFSLGRLFFAVALLVYPCRRLYWQLPLTFFVLSVALASFPSRFLFCSVGFLYSSLYPLAIAFAIKTFWQQQSKAVGICIATFVGAFGLSAFGVGQSIVFAWISREWFFPLVCLIAAGITIFNSLTLKLHPETSETRF